MTTLVRAVDDPESLARGARLIRVALERRRARLAAEQQEEPLRAAG